MYVGTLEYILWTHQNYTRVITHVMYFPVCVYKFKSECPNGLSTGFQNQEPDKFQPVYQNQEKLKSILDTKNE